MSSFHPTPGPRPLLDQLYDFGIVPGGTPIPFSAALLAFRLHHAVFMPDVTVAMIQGQVAQMLFEARTRKLFTEQGMDFYKRVFIPEYHTVISGKKYFHEDGVHKPKRITAHTRLQPSSADSQPLLISRKHVLDVCEDVPELQHLVAIMEAHADD